MRWSYITSWIRITAIRVVAVLLLMCACAMLLFAFAALVNEDFFARESQSVDIGCTVAHLCGEMKDHVPRIILVLDKVSREENSVQAHLILLVHSAAAVRLQRQGVSTIRAEVRDASSPYLFGVVNGVTISLDKPPFGGQELTSPVFSLPSYGSVAGFPLDTIHVRPAIQLEDNEHPGIIYPAEVTIVRSFPGRTMTVKDDGGFPVLTLSRTWIEMYMVGISSAAFVLICLMVSIKLFTQRYGVTGLQELLAMAGFLIAAGEYKSIIGLPSDQGTSAFEIGIFGLPLLFLTIGMAVSAIRRQSAQSTKEQG